MIPPGSRLVLLLRLVDRIPLPAPDRGRRGRPRQYSGRLFLKALVVMIVRHLHRPGEMLAVLDEPTPEMLQVRALLSDGGRAVAIDSTPMHARGGVWHAKHRAAGVVPHTSIDTEAHWTKSGWHGWVYGWKLHLISTVASVWIPLAAELTPANVADNEVAPLLLTGLPAEARSVLGDLHYNAPNVREACNQADCLLITRTTVRTRTPMTG